VLKEVAAAFLDRTRSIPSVEYRHIVVACIELENYDMNFMLIATLVEHIMQLRCSKMHLRVGQ
jgi:hypothetical protein